MHTFNMKPISRSAAEQALFDECEDLRGQVRALEQKQAGLEREREEAFEQRDSAQARLDDMNPQFHAAMEEATTHREENEKLTRQIDERRKTDEKNALGGQQTAKKEKK